jgi:hypothetical protein
MPGFYPDETSDHDINAVTFESKNHVVASQYLLSQVKV